MKGPGVEKQNPSRRARRLPPSRRFKPQGLGVVPNGTCLLKVRSFLGNTPNVVAARENKLIQKDNADSGVQVIIPAGPRQSLLLAKDPDQFFGFLFNPLCFHPHLVKPTKGEQTLREKQSWTTWCSGSAMLPGR